MNVTRDPDAILAAWLEEGPRALPEPTRRAIAVATRTTSQPRRPIWMPLRRPSMNPFARIAIAVTVLAVLIGGALYALAPSNGVVGGPPSSPAASPTPSPATAVPTTSSVVPFTSATFKIPIAFTLSDGWSLQANESGVVGLGLGDAEAFIVSIDATTVRGATPSAPWVPWPADIHAWLAGRPELKTGATRTGVVGGRPAVIVDAEYVRDKITDPGDWLKYGTGASDGMNWSGSWPGSLHVIVVKTGPTSGIVVVMDAPTDAFSGASATLDKLLTGLTFR